MARLGPLIFNERLALGMLALFVPVYFGAWVMLYPSGIRAEDGFGALLLWKVLWLIAWVLAACVAIATMFLRPDAHPSGVRRTMGRFLPLAALLAALPINFVIGNALTGHAMRTFAANNSARLDGVPPRAIIYSEGVPDGGVAIVRSPGQDPSEFSQSRMLELTGERITSCAQLDARDWSCRFD